MLDLDAGVRNSLVAQTATEELTLLSAWCRGFEALHGQAPAILPHPTAAAEFPAAKVIRIPPIFPEPGKVGGIGHFKHRPGLVSHMRRMGYDWTESGTVIQAPTPATLNLLLASWGFASAGFRTCITYQDETRMNLATWLRLYVEGVIPVSLQTPAQYDLLRPGVDLSKTLFGSPGKARNHFLLLPHDLTLHAQNYHLVPREALQIIKTMIFEAMPERVREWAVPGALAPLTLTFFFDNDFNQYTYSIWCECEGPEEFTEMYLRRVFFDQLKEALRLRIRETLEGAGDVSSGRTEEMRPLGRVQFSIADDRKRRGPR